MKFLARDLIVVAIAGLVALISARPYAGGYNDGGRLASVESLVDHRTWRIDHSIFSGDAEGGGPGIWTPGDPLPGGTGDKLYIQGHFYSDKPPVTALAMAAVYQVLQSTTGLVARESPNTFCYAMALTSSGLAYVLAVWCLYRIAVRHGLGWIATVVLTSSFAFATVAPAYARQANASMILLAIVSALLLVLLHFDDEGPISWKLPTLAGWLAGFGYSTDLGSGPILLLCSGAFVFQRSGFRIKPMIFFGLGAFPLFGLHHYLNYAIGGTIGPMNTVPEYFDWPHSTFNKANLTGGGAGPASILAFLSYGRGFLFGARGFLCHNYVLFLAIAGGVALGRFDRKSRPIVLMAVAWSVGTLVLYAWKSNDFSGRCISIRWLVPTLAAAYLILAKMLQKWPETVSDLAALSLCSLPISLSDWMVGPFQNNTLRHLPISTSLILGSWLLVFLWRSGRLPFGRFETPLPPTERARRSLDSPTGI